MLDNTDILENIEKQKESLADKAQQLYETYEAAVKSALWQTPL